MNVFQEIYTVHLDQALKGSVLNKESDLLIKRCGFNSLLQEALVLLTSPEATFPTYQLILTSDVKRKDKCKENCGDFKCIAIDMCWKPCRNN